MESLVKETGWKARTKNSLCSGTNRGTGRSLEAPSWEEPRKVLVALLVGDVGEWSHRGIWLPWKFLLLHCARPSFDCPDWQTECDHVIGCQSIVTPGSQG